jgi:hypothetical protein
VRARSLISLSMPSLACSWSFVRTIVPNDGTKSAKKAS